MSLPAVYLASDCVVRANFRDDPSVSSWLSTGANRCVLLAGVRRLGQLQVERHGGGLRHPLRQPCAQRAGQREVRGILGAGLIDPCVLPLTVSLPRPHRDTSSSMLDPTECMETAEEQRVHSPPASLVPRLHVVHVQPLEHINPLLPVTSLEDNSACEDNSLSTSTVCVSHREMFILFSGEASHTLSHGCK